MEHKTEHIYPCQPEVENPSIAIQGVKGSFHHIASDLLFGPGAEYLERDSFDQVFDDCAEGRAHYALVAIENSIAGSLLQNYDLLAKNHLTIIGEALLRIEHHLVAHPDITLDQVEEIWSHPMAINQSKEFLDALDIHIKETRDTAATVQKIKEEGLKEIAAISSDRSAEIFDMQVIRSNIETDPHNYTRFLLLGDGHDIKTKESHPFKTTFHLSVVEKPGSLASLLQLIADEGINMTMIESRPQVGKPWQYDFFIDLQMNASNPDHKDLINQMKKKTIFLDILGSYPCFGYIKE